MSKELEALEKLNHTICLNSPTIKWGIDTYDHIDCKDDKEFVKCYNIIRKALKRNEPMKVILKDKGFEHYDVYCPKCKEYVGFKNSVRESLALNYCPNCGQNLEWEKLTNKNKTIERTLPLCGK